MSDPRTLGPWLRRFLTEYIVTERNLARNTQKSYRDTFAPPAAVRRRQDPQAGRATHGAGLHGPAYPAVPRPSRGGPRLLRADPQPAPVGDPLLRALRRQPRPRTSRLGAPISAAIASKKATPQPISWLSKIEMQELLQVADRRSPRGRIEHAFLLFLYNTGARVSEATQLVAGDLQIGRRDGAHALVNIHGKGGKHRQCPLWPRTEAVLAQLVQGRATSEAVFLSRLRRPYTRFGIYRLVERSAARVPSLAGRRITPHMIRHTSACHLLQAGIDLNTIRAWLGHASLETTNIYAEIDMEMKTKAMALCDAAEPGTGRPWKMSKGLMAFLGAL